MSGTVLGSGDTAENKTDQNPCLGGADIPGWGGCGGGMPSKLTAEK